MVRIISLLLVISAPALAQTSDCAVFGEIADEAATARLAEADMTETMIAIAESYEGKDARFGGAVPLIVDYVWTLDEDLLEDGVGAAWQAQCEAQ